MTQTLSALRIQRRELPGTEAAGCDVSVYVRADGTCRVHKTLFGADVEANWGEADVERWSDVTAPNAARLFAELVKDRFGQEPDALGAFVSYCESRGIPHVTGTWL